VFSPSRFSSRVVLDQPTEADTQPGWDSVLRDLATEPDRVVMPARATPSERPLPVAPARRGFGGLLDLLLIVAAVVTAAVVAAVGAAVFLVL
jgi:hypothetical protein